jgi:hypothetical protein
VSIDDADLPPTTIRFFGTPWNAPACEGRPFEAPPVGQPCARGCGQAITALDSGLMIPLLGAATEPEWTVWHRACFLAHIGAW